MKTRAVSLILALALLSGCAVSGADASPQANPSVSGAAQAGYPVATPTPTPTPVPEPTPTPTPTVEPTPTPAPTPEPTPTPTPTPPPTPTAEPSASTGPSPSPEPAELPEEPFFIDLTLVGDCLLSTYKGENYEGSLNWYAENREPAYFFEKVASYFEQDDFTIVNLETVLTDRPLEEVDKGGGRVFWFRGPARNAEILSSSSVEVASLSNNHIRDYGDEGVADTIAAVEAAGVEYGNWGRTVYLGKNGFVIAVLCCGLWGEWNTGGIVDRIRNESEKSDYQLVFFHGGIERSRAPEEWMVTACHSLIDAGADLVVGAHPHVLQPMEEYNGKRIVYSLGNFCFGGNTGPENRTVLYQVRLTVDGGAVREETHTLVPCYVFTGYTNNWQPAPITDETQKQYVLDFMAGLREKPF